jgi:hypothetical protein
MQLQDARHSGQSLLSSVVSTIAGHGRQKCVEASGGQTGDPRELAQAQSHGSVETEASVDGLGESQREQVALETNLVHNREQSGLREHLETQFRIERPGVVSEPVIARRSRTGLLDGKTGRFRVIQRA